MESFSKRHGNKLLKTVLDEHKDLVEKFITATSSNTETNKPAEQAKICFVPVDESRNNIDMINENDDLIEEMEPGEIDQSTVSDIEKRLNRIEAKLESLTTLTKKSIRVGEANGKLLDTLMEHLSVDREDSLGIDLPVTTIEDLMELEARCADKEFCKNLVRLQELFFFKFNLILIHPFQTIILRKYKGANETILRPMIRELLADTVLLEYNWDGRASKLPLNKLYLFSNVVRDVCVSDTFSNDDYITAMQKSIKTAKNRCYSNTSRTKEKNESL